jgi:hypothetical protein
MEEKAFSTEELYDLTAAKLGHCNDVEQLEFVIRYIQYRIGELKRRSEKEKKT